MVNREEGEVTYRLTMALGTEEAGILIDVPPRLQPGDTVLGVEASGLLAQEVIEANADKIDIAIPDPETGEVGLIWYESLTQKTSTRYSRTVSADKRWWTRRARGCSITSPGCRRRVCKAASLGSIT